MFIFGRVAEEGYWFLHRRWWNLRPNAAPEWQAGGLRWHSRELVVACTLKGPVRTIVSFICLGI
jgi:hypothetical protein